MACPHKTSYNMAFIRFHDQFTVTFHTAAQGGVLDPDITRTEKMGLFGKAYFNIPFSPENCLAASLNSLEYGNIIFR